MRVSRIIRWRVALVAITGVVIPMGVIAEASPAQAAGCYGDYCSGQDPSTTGTGGIPCGDGARTVAATDLEVWRVPAGSDQGYWAKVGSLQLRWSDRCGTNWARLELTSAASIRDVNVVQSTNYNQSYKTSGWDSDWTNPGVFWTNMIYSPTAACRAYVTGGSFRRNTTDWR